MYLYESRNLYLYQSNSWRHWSLSWGHLGSHLCGLRHMMRKGCHRIGPVCWLNGTPFKLGCKLLLHFNSYTNNIWQAGPAKFQRLYKFTMHIGHKNSLLNVIYSNIQR